MAQKKSTIHMRKQKEKNGMQILAATFLVLFIFCFTSSVFAQDKNVQPVHPLKDGLGEQIDLNDNENKSVKKEVRKIPLQGSIVDVSAAPDALVNNNDGSTGTGNFTQSETDILAFGSNVLIGFNDSGSYSTGSHFTGFSYSTDGGASFTDGGTFPSTDFGDPAMGRNETSGRIYFSTLGSSTIQVFRSDDDGVTWMSAVNGTPGGSSEDKQWLAVDNFAGAGNGNVYLMSRRFGGSSGIYMFRSTDDGASFTPNGGVSIFSGGQGAFVTVGPDHSVYAFYYNGSTNIQVRKSTDFGVTFGSAVTVVSGLDGGVNGDMDLTGLRQGTASYSYFRSNSFPHASVNPVSGHIYVTFNDNPAGADKADIYMVMSTDGGTTWSARTQVNDDGTTTDQWQPTIAITPDGNNLGIFYYSRQEDTADNNLFKFYGRLATISGSTVSFSPGFPISDVASLPEFGRDNVVNSVYMGDYNHATATPTGFHVVWSDNRNDLPGGGSRKDPNCYYEFIQIGPPCPVGVASNPNPASGTTGVDINLPQISWTNGSGATSIDVFFDGANVYSGPLVTSYTIPAPLDFSTTYSWRVDTNNDSCTAYGSSWTFTTMDDPNIVNLFCDDFTAGLGNWTIVNDGGTCVWDIFQASDFTMPPTAVGNVMAADADDCGSGTTLLSTATLTSPIDATMYNSVWIEFDNDWQAIDAQDFAILEVSIDGGTTWQEVFAWGETDIRNTHENWDVTSMVAQETFIMRFVSIQPGWDWWWAVDNVCVYGTDPVPVELTSFNASASGVDVQLNWSTATETNNQGFYVERMVTGSSFEQTGFVAGFGTTTEPKTYTFVDPNLDEGNYTYRIKQVDFDGTFEYSEEVNVVVELPLEYGLGQNYPNPFNPSTTIKYSLADDGFVKLAIYNMLGEEVATIVNATQKAGRYEVNFNASDLSSGVYVYRIEAGNFVSSKKLMLLK